MKATLVYPPIGDPRAPQLALPSLAAVLRRAGIKTDLVDLNLSGILALLRSDRISRAAKILHDRGGDRERLLSRLAGRAAELAPEAVAILRSERFYDANEYNAARDAIFTALAAAGAAAATPVAVGLFPIRYDAPGINAQVLHDLVQITADRGANIFAEYWEEEWLPLLDRERPDFVGITITNRQQIIPGLMLARTLRERGHFVVLGGALYAKFADQLRRLPEFFRVFADGVVVYEGETAVLSLADELGGARNLGRIPNFLHLSPDGDVRMGPIKVENVEQLPTPDFTGLPLTDYFAPAPVLPILTGKGCYFNRCKFCDIPFINHVAQKNYRVRSPEKIVRDVQELSSRFGARHFVITDEALAPKLLEDLAEAFDRESTTGCSFTGYARLEPGFTLDLCRRLQRMGMRKLFFGMESAAQETLDHMDKGTKTCDAPFVLENCRKAGIAFHVFSIIGFPEETEESARKTFQFFIDHKEVFDHPANSFDVHPFGLELRTEYFAERETCGIDVSPAALTRDFPIGVAGGEWTNARGLSIEQVFDLIENDFYPQLRRCYRNYHNMRGQLWPGFEEYSMLYGDYYRNRPFPFRTTLPDAAESERVCVRLNPTLISAQTTDDDGACMVTVTGPEAGVSIPKSLYAFLSESRARSVCELTVEADEAHDPAEITARTLQFRHDIEQLIEYGLVQVKLVPAVDPATAPPDRNG